MLGTRLLSLAVLGITLTGTGASAQTQTPPTSASPETPSSSPQTPSPSSSQSPVTPPAFRSGIDVVALSVTVLDGSQRLIGDLARQDFAVFEDGVRQDISYFETRDVPLDLALLIDTSVSMSPNLGAVQRAAQQLASMLRPCDRAAVMAFNDRVHVLTPFTSDTAAVAQAIGSTRPAGATALFNAVYVALREFRKTLASDGTVRRRAIVVLSDGEDTASLLSFDQLMTEARRAGVTVYTIGLRVDQTTGYLAARGRNMFSNADFEMRALAQETGATVHFPKRPSEVAAAYADIGRELAQQYSIGYVSRNPVQSGKFRRVIVQVVDRPEMRPRTRPGYVAGSATELAMAGPATSTRVAAP
jgi:Ca-activated chloride channel family protein